MNLTRNEGLRRGVCEAYSRAAIAPAAKHPFPVGRRFAEGLGYRVDDLDTLPAISVEAFSGVSNLWNSCPLPPSSRVLDLGCGAGLDSLIAARRVGAAGLVMGVDFSAAMLARAHQAALQTAMRNVHFVRAAAEMLPIKTGAVDVALANGIFNLNPSRVALFSELARVVRPGGSVCAAELILTGPLPPHAHASEESWFAWIAGAREGGALLEEFRAAGFAEAVILKTSHNARARDRHTLAAEIRARR